MADSVISDKQVKYLLTIIDHSNNGVKWKEALIDFTNKLLEKED